MALNTSIDLKHNYPIPDDEVETKTIAIKEVEANVRSKQSYMVVQRKLTKSLMKYLMRWTE